MELYPICAKRSDAQKHDALTHEMGSMPMKSLI